MQLRMLCVTLYVCSGADCARLSQQSLTHMEFGLAELWNSAARELTTEPQQLTALQEKLTNIRATVRDGEMAPGISTKRYSAREPETLTATLYKHSV